MKKIWAAVLLLSFFPLFASKKTDTLFQAVTQQNAGEITVLLKKNSDYVNATRGKQKESLLMAAVTCNRDIDVINALLKYGADVTKKTKNGVTALMLACQYETDTAVIDALIKADTILSKTRENRVLQKDKEKKCAFDYALQNPDPAAVIALLEGYAENPLPKEVLPLTPPQEEAEPAAEEAAADQAAAAATAEEALSEAGTAAVQETVTEQGPAPEQVPETEPAAVKAEADRAYTGAPDVDITPFTPTYLLDYAELESEPEITEPAELDTNRFRHTFIPNPDARDSEGRTLLMKAVRDGNEELIADLLYSEADIQLKDKDGWTALMFAARFQSDPAITRKLLALGADVTATNNYGLTALALAAGFSDAPDVVAALLEGRSAAEKDVRAAFIYAVTMEAATDILALFTDKGISLNAPYNGKTPLMYAAESNTSTTVISWLLKHGAKNTYRTSGGKTAFDFAQANSRLPHNESYWALNASTDLL